jgi:hypothetical protein
VQCVRAMLACNARACNAPVLCSVLCSARMFFL